MTLEDRRKEEEMFREFLTQEENFLQTKYEE